MKTNTKLLRVLDEKLDELQKKDYDPAKVKALNRQLAEEAMQQLPKLKPIIPKKPFPWWICIGVNLTAFIFGYVVYQLWRYW